MTSGRSFAITVYQRNLVPCCATRSRNVSTASPPRSLAMSDDARARDEKEQRREGTRRRRHRLKDAIALAEDAREVTVLAPARVRRRERTAADVAIAADFVPRERLHREAEPARVERFFE